LVRLHILLFLTSDTTVIKQSEELHIHKECRQVSCSVGSVILYFASHLCMVAVLCQV